MHNPFTKHPKEVNETYSEHMMCALKFAFKQIRSLNEIGLITEELDKGHRFSKVVIDKGSAGSEIVVIGDPLAVEKLLNTRNYVLRG